MKKSTKIKFRYLINKLYCTLDEGTEEIMVDGRTYRIKDIIEELELSVSKNIKFCFEEDMRYLNKVNLQLKKLNNV